TLSSPASRLSPGAAMEESEGCDGLARQGSEPSATSVSGISAHTADGGSSAAAAATAAEGGGAAATGGSDQSSILEPERLAATAERYSSYIRQRSAAGTREDGGSEERETEKGYEGGDRVRLLVGSFNVGNSPLTDLAPWLPYGGKGFDLIVVGLQESTYRAPRNSRESSSPFQTRSPSLSPSNSLSPAAAAAAGAGKAGRRRRSPPLWGTYRSEDLPANDDDDPTATPPPGRGFT
ncbi:unnamed protein product, partial [Scytosiphon promiscuus]